MIQVVYTSRATRPLPPVQLSNLVVSAQQHNRRVGITGLLIAYNGSYMQLLEGPAVAVEPLLKRIRGDGRHTNVMTQLHDVVSERRCPRWAMAVAGIDEEEWQQVLGAIKVPNPPLSLDLVASPGTAVALIDHYVDRVFRGERRTHGSAFGARSVS